MMIVLSLLMTLQATNGNLVLIGDINKTQDYVILYTSSRVVEQAFIDAAHHTTFQSAYLFCIDALSCNLTSQSKALVSVNSTMHPYQWEYTYEGFLSFFQKITYPLPMIIKNKAELETFQTYPFSFVYFYNDSQQLQEFSMIISAYAATPLYFAAVANYTDGLKEVFSYPNLRVFGLDAKYEYYTKENIKEFIEKRKCPLLLPYEESLWVENCCKEKIVVFAVINKQRKGQWNMYAGKLKLFADELRKNNEESYQMAYVDTKSYPQFTVQWQVPIVPCIIIKDFRTNHTYYLGEYSLRSHKKLAKLLREIEKNTANSAEFTLETLEFTNYISFSQLLPLLFLVFGALLLLVFCYKSTFPKKQKAN
jgi:hypothetical protein